MHAEATDREVGQWVCDFTLADGIHQFGVPAAQFRLILDELAHFVRKRFTGPTRYIGVVLDRLNQTHERGRIVEIHRAASFLTGILPDILVPSVIRQCLR